jgi:predicted metalloprotease with PDZ domain
MAAAPIRHSLRMDAPHTHYFDVTTEVEISASAQKKKFVDFKMAAWTPGSYLIREFAKNVERVQATIDGKKSSITKINKNTWRVPVSPGQSTITVSYSVYAFELSVRTSFLDDSHGYINPASVFLYVPEYAKSAQELTVIPFKDFKKVSSAMKEVKKFTFQAKNLDEWIDSPIEIGNHKVWEFKVNQVPHQIAFYGPAKVDSAVFLADVKKMCEEAQRVVGDHPCDHYLFIIHNLYRGGGGLEHLYSTTCQVSRANYENPNGYRGILNLLAHEYFHLWNVKRIRPMALGPFDYENENYTHNLWLSEGITSYYADVILQRTGQSTTDEYLKGLAQEISMVENTPGNQIESAASASWDAWIKYYRPNENSRNSTVSYYDKGSLLGGVLNMWIIKSTQGQKCLDDVFKLLYATYYQKLGRGFTDAELENAFSQVAGVSAKSIFETHIYGTQTPAYADLFQGFGYDWTDENVGKTIPYLGFTAISGRITSVSRVGSAYQAGLNVGDEILKVNQANFEGMDKLLADKKPGDVLNVVIRRDGIERFFVVPVIQSPLHAFTLTPTKNMTDAQKKLRLKWLGNR